MNRKNLRSLAVVLLFMTVCWVAGSSAAPRQIQPGGLAGGWSQVEANNAEVVKAAEEAVKAVTSESESLQLMSIKKAEQQIVAGVNYRLTLHLTRNGRQQDADVLIWWQAWRNPDPYRLMSWSWK